MTDRYNALTVVLEQDTRDDDAQALIQAIAQLRGVLKVEPNVARVADFVGQERARHELGQKLLKVLYPQQGS